MIESLKEIPLEQVAFASEPPIFIETIGWHSTTEELSTLIEELKSLPSLRINDSGLAPKGWAYVGFMGGPEPGGINLTYCLQKKEGDFYTLSATLNHTTKAIDTSKLYALIGQLLLALYKGII